MTSSLTAVHENKYLVWWTADADRHFLVSTDDSFAMTKYLKTILEECRLDRHKILEVSQRYWMFKQLPAELVREVSKYELMGIRHEVILIKLVAHVFRSHLTADNYTVRDIRKINKCVYMTVSYK